MKIFIKFFKLNNFKRTFCIKKDVVKDEKYYEQEWNNLFVTKFNEKKKYLENQLSPSEKKEVELLVEAMNILDPDERKLFLLLLKIKVQNITGVNPLSVDLSSPSSISTKENMWPKENPDWFKTSHFSSTLSAFKGVKIKSIKY
jgi:hypothetical protein